jgi:hypothetical protein
VPGIKSLKEAQVRVEEIAKKVRQQQIDAQNSSNPSPQETPVVAEGSPAMTATPVVTEMPSPPVRPVPSEVVLTAPVQVSVMIGGRNAGDVTLQPGVRVKLISVEGEQLKIQYMETVTTIPRQSTDLGTP